MSNGNYLSLRYEKEKERDSNEVPCSFHIEISELIFYWPIISTLLSFWYVKRTLWANIITYKSELIIHDSYHQGKLTENDPLNSLMGLQPF